MIQPTPEQWALLTPVEKVNFMISDYVNRDPKAKHVFSRIASVVGKSWVEFFVSNLCPDHGFEKFAKIDPTRGVLLVANHRSFFDLFAVTARLFTMYGNHHQVQFPVRSTFFYDHYLGHCVNLPLAWGTMYPMIMRDKNRRGWNRFSTELLVELLQDPRNMVGFHPEGTRSRTKDPYELLPGRPGCGELIHRSRPNVIPVFLQGFPRYAWHGPLINHGPLKHKVLWAHMVMGDPMDFSQEWSEPASPELNQRIVDRVMAAIKGLGEQEKEIRRTWKPPQS